ncbi:hypothetical protein QYM36_000779 [Artemia franciscana]|uniref:Uncharacterized protein n=1 Tax=Artemia franciscana TaxID=6661 RepID=A0AA88LCN6_ARTSF|nr:hypothetical protein QYM36_000779 [Artemia franciscana]
MATSTNENHEPECSGAKQIINNRKVTSTAEFYAEEVDFSIDLFKRVYKDNGGIKSKQTTKNILLAIYRPLGSAPCLSWVYRRNKQNFGEVFRLEETYKATTTRFYKATLHRFSSATNFTQKTL